MDGPDDADGGPPVDRRDAEWLVLTDGMSPKERFRYIARHILEAAIEEAARYAADERIFDDLDGDDQARRNHLQRLDDALREDDAMSPLERAFLCAAVRAAMEDHEMEARCLSDLVGVIAEADEWSHRP